MTNYFGTQAFSTSDPKKDKKIVYSFQSNKDRDIWLQADMSPFAPGGIDKKHHRSAVNAKQADKLMKEGAQAKDFKSQKDFVIAGSYGHIKHPDPKYKDNFGVVIRFDNTKQLAEFSKRNADYYKDDNGKPTFSTLKNTDKRVVAANVNGAALKFTDDKQFDSRVKMALKAYPQLDPSRNHLVMISQKKDFSKPELYSFNSKSYRDYFVDKINGKKSLPIVAGKMANFHPIAIDHATKGKILSGTLSEHFQHKDQYLSMNNANDKALSSVASKEMISQKDFSERANAGVKDFTSKDLRGIDFSGINLKGMDFSNSSFAGQNLDGVDFSNTTAKGADFSKTSLNGAKFDKAILRESNFKNATAKTAAVSFNASDLVSADMKYMDTPKSDLRDSKLVRANLYKSNLKDAATVGANLNGTGLNACNLEGAKMDQNMGAYKGASFTGANLKGTALESSPLNAPKKDQGAAKAM